jgi:hypothetical protein
MAEVSIRRSGYSVTAIYRSGECGVDWTATVLRVEGIVDMWHGNMSPAFLNGRSASEVLREVLNERIDGLPL